MPVVEVAQPEVVAMEVEVGGEEEAKMDGMKRALRERIIMGAKEVGEEGQVGKGTAN